MTATDAREMAAQCRLLEERLRIVAEASQEFSAATYDAPRLLEAVARRLGEIVGDLCAIRTVSEDGLWLEANGAAYHRDAELLAATRALMLTAQRVGAGVSGRVAASGQPDFTPVISTAAFVASSQPEYRPYLERLQVTSSIALPLLCRGKVVGVANLMRGGASAPYAEEDLRLVQSVAVHAALAIGSARSFAAERAARVAAETATRALRQAEARFGSLRDAGILGIIVADLEPGAIVDVNDTLLEMIGFSREEILSGSVPWEQLTPPEWADVDARALDQLATEGIGALREKELLRKDGTRVPVLIGSAMLEGSARECISFVLDLSERNKAQQELERLHVERAGDARFRALLETAPDAMVIVGDGGLISLVNGQAESLFGYSRAELHGAPIELLIPVRPAGASAAQGAGATGGAVELWGRRKDGGEFPIEVTLSPLVTGDSRLVSRSIRDISERKRAEAALADARDAALAATRELEAFSYSVAHDLRAPLRGMNGFAQALLADYADKLDADGVDYLEEIRSNAAKMGSLIDALLSLSRVSRSDWAPEETDLAALFRRTAAGLVLAEPRRKVSIVAPGTLLADVDPHLVRTLFDNLVGNAWKFTARVEEARIELGTTEREGERVIFIRDNGAGFDMAHASKLFAPFHRLHTEAEFPGTGIGLATVQRIVRRHGGRLWAEGSVGQGAAFYFTLPGHPRLPP